jgi:hypothetical protein
MLCNIKDVGLNRFAVVLRFKLRFFQFQQLVYGDLRHLSLV